LNIQKEKNKVHLFTIRSCDGLHVLTSIFSNDADFLYPEIDVLNAALEHGERVELMYQGEKFNIQFESCIKFIFTFQSESTLDKVYEILINSDPETKEYWSRQVDHIMAKLNSQELRSIRDGISELSQWVDGYNRFYVESTMGDADLSLFGYDVDNLGDECNDLWSNPLFDDILEKYGIELGTETLFDLIYALFMPNEDYMDCKATFTAINILLQNRNPEIEARLVDACIRGLSGYEPCHRCYENSFLDRLIKDILPTFNTAAIIKLLLWASDDLLDFRPGDELVLLIIPALEKTHNNEQEVEIVTIILHMFKQRWFERDKSYYDLNENLNRFTKNLKMDNANKVIKYVNHLS